MLCCVVLCVCEIDRGIFEGGRSLVWRDFRTRKGRRGAGYCNLCNLCAVINVYRGTVEKEIARASRKNFQ